MNLTDTEKQILNILKESNLLTNNELRKKLDGSVKCDVSAISVATRTLMEKDLVTAINPLGSTCYIITQKGTKFLREFG